MTRVLIAAAVLLAGIGAADATSHQKRYKAVRSAPVAAYVPVYPVVPNRPVWAAPWQCFTDEGYGRFRPCDAGPNRR